jgi:hypothetical protein
VYNSNINSEVTAPRQNSIAFIRAGNLHALEWRLDERRSVIITGWSTFEASIPS